MIPTALAGLLVLLLLAVPVAAALGVLGLGLAYLFSPLPIHRVIGEMSWSANNEFLLVAVPMFILMGEILLRAGVAERMYEGLAKWLAWLPGGLMHSNIAASAMFAATSGSSVATAATIGTVAIPQARRFRYDERLFLGSLAAGGTLGILIPPSINLIIYAVLTNSSVPRLYLAGILPGLLLALVFMAFLLVACLLRPERGGAAISASWRERFLALFGFLPPMAIFMIVVGSIYAGLATPTEAAALGVVAALLLAAASGRLDRRMLSDALTGTMKSTAMIMLIIIAAYFLNFVMTAIGLTRAITDAVTGLGLGPTATLVLVVAFYLVLGCFMETLSMLITTVPVIAPVMFALGYDPIWFGIVITLLVEAALITPPVGLNLFIVQHVRGSGNMRDVMWGALPFFGALLLMILLLALFPGIATLLPGKVMG
ncbi:MAG: TRAP transporter large permease [Alphaproteobacteria bacterium]